jgi:hypothetical protein
LDLLDLPRKWNNGMVERWNIGFQKDINHLSFIVNPAGGGAINTILNYPRTHYSNIPEFQHSNWGEAPNLPFCPEQF